MSHSAKVKRCGTQPLRPGGLVSGRALVVDDNPETRSMSLRYLASSRCLAIGTTRAAMVRHLQRDLFSLVVTDTGAGPDDGFELLRKISALSDLPVILIAGARRTEGCCCAQGTRCLA